MSEQALVVKRWRRYGMDRLYVQTVDGAKVGFWDLKEEVAHPESESDAESLAAAVQQWRAEQGAPEVQPEPKSVAPVAEMVEPDRPWIDLAGNAPGAEARGRATAARAEAPVKSLMARLLGVHTDERA